MRYLWVLLLGAMAQANAIEVQLSYTWAGLSPTWPGYDYQIGCSTQGKCVLSGQRWVSKTINNRDKQPTCRHNNRAIEARGLLENLYQAVQRNLEAVGGPVEEIDHTDDYPRFSIILKTPEQTLQLLNTSNTRKPPWNVQRDGQWFVQRTGEIEAAFKALVKVIPCEAK